MYDLGLNLTLVADAVNLNGELMIQINIGCDADENTVVQLCVQIHCMSDLVDDLFF